MRLTPKERERLTIFVAAEMARRRRAGGLRLNYPESLALICDEVLEMARAGRSYEEVVEAASRILRPDDVMEGVAGMLKMIQVEACFEDGTKLITIERPVR